MDSLLAFKPKMRLSFFLKLNLFKSYSKVEHLILHFFSVNYPRIYSWVVDIWSELMLLLVLYNSQSFWRSS